MTFVPQYLEFGLYILVKNLVCFGHLNFVFIDKLHIFIIIYQFFDEIKIIIIKYIANSLITNIKMLVKETIWKVVLDLTYTKLDTLDINWGWRRDRNHGNLSHVLSGQQQEGNISYQYLLLWDVRILRLG